MVDDCNTVHSVIVVVHDIQLCAQYFAQSGVNHLKRVDQSPIVCRDIALMPCSKSKIDELKPKAHHAHVIDTV